MIPTRSSGVRELSLAHVLGGTAPRSLLDELGKFSPVGTEKVDLDTGDDEDDGSESVKRLREAHESLLNPDPLKILSASLRVGRASQGRYAFISTTRLSVELPSTRLSRVIETVFGLPVLFDRKRGGRQ